MLNQNLTIPFCIRTHFDISSHIVTYKILLISALGAKIAKKIFAVTQHYSNILWPFTLPNPFLFNKIYLFQHSDAAGTSVFFYAMDSQSLNAGKYDPEAQIEDMEKTLNETEASWKIVFGHNPPLSVGQRWGDQVVLDQVVLLFHYQIISLFSLFHCFITKFFIHSFIHYLSPKKKRRKKIKR